MTKKKIKTVVKKTFDNRSVTMAALHEELSKPYPEIYAMNVNPPMAALHEELSKPYPEILEKNVDDKRDKTLIQHDKEDLLTWRNAASKRIDDNIAYHDWLVDIYFALLKDIPKIERKISSDKLWCAKLNRVLYKKIFKTRPHRQ